MTWRYGYIGNDQAPFFTDDPDRPSEIFQHGPFPSLEAARGFADDALRHDINVFRRALSALRRGEFQVIRKVGNDA